MLNSMIGRLRALEDRLSVRTQIAAAVVAMTLMLVGTLAAGSAFISYRNTSELVNSKLTAVAAATAARMDRYMSIRQQEIRLFTQLEPLRPLWKNDPKALGRALDQLQSTFKGFTWIGFARPDGTVIAATGGLLQGKSVAERPWFKNGLEDLSIGDVHEAKLLAALLANSTAGEPLRFVDISLPIKDKDGILIGVLGAHLNWDWARDLIASVGDVGGDDVTTLSVISTNGVVLVGADTGTTRYSGEQLDRLKTIRSGTFTDKKLLTAFYVTKGYQEYQGLNWIVTASQPTSVAMAAALTSAQTIFGLGTIIGILGVSCGLLLAGRIARPIRAITEEADRLGRTLGPTMLQRQNGSLEVVHLTRALRSLLRRIGFAEERTKEAEARATENAQQFQDDLIRLRHIADTDHLTGLMNRRAFLVAANDAVAYCHRYRRSAATLMIDIDHFKLINDRYGHAAGDTAIRRIAQIIENCVRTTDKAARFGGEEFVVLLREIDEAGAMALADRIRLAVAQETLGSSDTAVSATVSIGVSMIANSDRDVQDMIARADQGLYVAKNRGRNCIFMIPFEGAGVSRAA